MPVKSVQIKSFFSIEAVDKSTSVFFEESCAYESKWLGKIFKNLILAPPSTVLFVTSGY